MRHDEMPCWPAVLVAYIFRTLDAFRHTGVSRQPLAARRRRPATLLTGEMPVGRRPDARPAASPMRCGTGRAQPATDEPHGRWANRKADVGRAAVFCVGNSEAARRPPNALSTWRRRPGEICR